MRRPARWFGGTRASDASTAAIVHLFHPRKDRWEDHFSIVGDVIVGLTPTGRATVWLLRMNAPERLELRATLRAASEL